MSAQFLSETSRLFFQAASAALFFYYKHIRLVSVSGRECLRVVVVSETKLLCVKPAVVSETNGLI